MTKNSEMEAKAAILDKCCQSVECLARGKVFDLVGTLDLPQSSSSVSATDILAEARMHLMCNRALEADKAIGRAIAILAVGHAQQAKEPIAWRWRHGPSGHWAYSEEKPEGPSIHLFRVEPLYAASPDTSTAGNSK